MLFSNTVYDLWWQRNGAEFVKRLTYTNPNVTFGNKTFSAVQPLLKALLEVYSCTIRTLIILWVLFWAKKEVSLETVFLHDLKSTYEDNLEEKI